MVMRQATLFSLPQNAFVSMFLNIEVLISQRAVLLNVILDVILNTIKSLTTAHACSHTYGPSSSTHCKIFHQLHGFSARKTMLRLY